MRALLLAAAALGTLASSAHAYTISSSATLPIHPTSPIPAISTPVVLTGLTSSNFVGPDTYRSPFEGTKYPNSPFTSIEGSGSAIFDFAQGTRKNTALTLIWGSPDNYNKLQIYAGQNGMGALLATIYGNNSAITPFSGAEPHNQTTPGLGYSFVKISGLANFGSIRLTNLRGSNAFEVSTISAVPLPASAPLFGLALMMVGGYGFIKRKRLAVSAA